MSQTFENRWAATALTAANNGVTLEAPYEQLAKLYYAYGQADIMRDIHELLSQRLKEQQGDL